MPSLNSSVPIHVSTFAGAESELMTSVVTAPGCASTTLLVEAQINADRHRASHVNRFVGFMAVFLSFVFIIVTFMAAPFGG
jgi:hypothetical protein